MPKKTKKEKIIAELRRKLETVKTETETITLPATHEIPSEKKELARRPISTVNYQMPTTKSFPVNSVSLKTEAPSIVLKDLRKTFLLAGLAISLELVVYWITELGGNKLLKFLPLKLF